VPAAARMRPEGEAEPAVEGPRVPTTEARSEQVRQAPPLREARSMTSLREQQPARWPEVPTTGRRLAIRMKLRPRPEALPMMVPALRWPPMKARAAGQPARRRERPMKPRARRVPRLGLRCPMHSRTARAARSRLEGVPQSAAKAAVARRMPVPTLGAAARLRAAAGVEPQRDVELGQVREALPQECAAVPMQAPVRRTAVQRRRVHPTLARVRAGQPEHAVRLPPVEPANSGAARLRRPMQGTSRRRAFPVSSTSPSVRPPRPEAPVLPMTVTLGPIPRSAGCRAQVGQEAGPSWGRPQAVVARQPPLKRPIQAWASSPGVPRWRRPFAVPVTQPHGLGVRASRRSDCPSCGP